MNRRQCNCKRTTQPKSFNSDYVPKLRAWWETNLKGLEYDEISFEYKQTLNVFFHDIYPLNQSTDNLFIYNKLKKLI